MDKQNDVKILIDRFDKGEIDLKNLKDALKKMELIMDYLEGVIWDVNSTSPTYGGDCVFATMLRDDNCIVAENINEVKIPSSINSLEELKGQHVFILHVYGGYGIKYMKIL